MMGAATRNAAAARLRPVPVVVGMTKKSLSRSRRLRARGFPMTLMAGGVRGGGRRNCSSTAPIEFVAPPEELEDGYFERPTPLLLVAGEGQAAAWWGGTASFLAARGCTVGTMTLTGRGKSATDTLTLRALQAGVAAAVDKSGLTPPVIVAHSMAGFVCQQYLQSYSASGLVLLDSFPPDPSVLANEHLRLARESYPCQPGDPAKTPPDLSAHEFAQLVKDNPARWEGVLRRHFAGVHNRSPWQAGITLPEDGSGSRDRAPSDVHVEVLEEKLSQVSSEGVRFPAKAFAQMCLTDPSSALRLESHVVETLVLGSCSGRVAGVGDSSVESGSSAEQGGDYLTLESAKNDGLDAICEFHGVGGWGLVDRGGRVGSGAGVGVDAATESGSPPWQEVVWDWYDTRF